MATLWKRLLSLVIAAVLTLALTAPIAAQETPSAPSLIVILAPGLNSTSLERGAAFMHLWPAIAALQPAALRVDFSYRGGDFDKTTGVWLGAPYTACDTQQSMFISAARLGTIIRNARERWPDARLAVVGHSLGGMIAAIWLAEATSQVLTPGDVPDTVVTIDSPLHGISPEHAAFGWITGTKGRCSTLQALPELVDFYRGRDADAIRNGIEIASAQGSGVAMVANMDDVAYSCCRGDQVVAPDIAWSQTVDAEGSTSMSFASILPDLPGLDTSQPVSHHTALFNQTIVDRLAALVVNDP